MPWTDPVPAAAVANREDSLGVSECMGKGQVIGPRGSKVLPGGGGIPSIDVQMKRLMQYEGNTSILHPNSYLLPPLTEKRSRMLYR